MERRKNRFIPTHTHSRMPESRDPTPNPGSVEEKVRDLRTLFKAHTHTHSYEFASAHPYKYSKIIQNPYDSRSSSSIPKGTFTHVHERAYASEWQIVYGRRCRPSSASASSCSRCVCECVRACAHSTRNMRELMAGEVEGGKGVRHR